MDSKAWVVGRGRACLTFQLEMATTCSTVESAISSDIVFVVGVDHLDAVLLSFTMV